MLNENKVYKNEIKSGNEIETDANSHIFKEQNDKNEGTLNNFVKTIYTKPEAKIIMPKQRTVNLKSPELRNKGINNRNNKNKISK